MTSNPDPIHIVIGSGPSGVAVSTALLKKGKRVLMLDAGQTVEPHLSKTLDLLYSQASNDWDPLNIAAIEGQIAPSSKGIPLKYAYGSDFPYRGISPFPEISWNESGILPSFALGGLSNVWGASVLPYSQEDLKDWPISLIDLAPHYREVEAMMNLIAEKDDLDLRFPIYSNKSGHIKQSNQAKDLLARLATSREPLVTKGVTFGRSRLAHNLPSYAHGEGCISCGLCMYGCPKRQIYNSESTLKVLQRNPRFIYRRAVVESFSEEGVQVIVKIYDPISHQFEAIAAEKLFIAAGVVPTTTIVAKSLKWFNRSIKIKDSQYFLFPMLTSKSIQNVTTESIHTLAQLFIEILQPSLCEKNIHLQIYTYNKLYSQLLNRWAGPFKSALNRHIQAFLGKLIIAQGYLHSDYSSELSFELKGDVNQCSIQIRSIPNPQSKQVIGRLIHFLKKEKRLLHATPVSSMLKIAEPGRGFHSGGTIPMSLVPNEGMADELGRPYSLKRVYCVDASVFSSIPSTTITLTAMANAHRIGTNA